LQTNQPPLSIKSSIDSLPLDLIHYGEDTPIWTLSETGKFYVSSAWKLLRQKRIKYHFESNIWQKEVSYKMPFITCRTIHNRLSTDDKISKFGITIDTNCSCCTIAGMTPTRENVEHLFYSGEFAQTMWQRFAGWLGIKYRSRTLSFLIECWNFKANNCVAVYILNIMPPIVIWEL
ncbi:hypothetical protein MTR67_023658, partial [Solanum verrucosum]